MKLLNTSRHKRILKEGKDNYLSGKPYRNPYEYLSNTLQVYEALYKQGWDEAEKRSFYLNSISNEVTK